ncbi:hypothetical protein BN14_04150 [Rhizoctonia solani AG-1 IB]|uniref:F-box domain-containing protein n=1 Tax=Thanatephorus cucumeris (strain AG1-IB / isolate 7/3/14) TaxID=1108050 RepID=M5BSE8_THACB|nr:hypothetical protein BN14_04150 [Rhizoctonia solani AG-1 IB]
MPSLAPELVLQILEEAYCSQFGAYTLSQAALVCSSWRSLSQEVLFRNVDLTRTPELRTSAARAAPGIRLAASGPSHAVRDTKAQPVSEARASRLRVLAALAPPSVPAPRSQRATLSFFNAIQMNSHSPSDHATRLSSLVRSVHVVVSRSDDCGCGGVHLGGICPKPCSAASPLPTGAITERDLASLLGKLRRLQNVHIILDRVTSFSPLIIDALHSSPAISTLSIHVLKRWHSRPQSSVSMNNAIQGSGAAPVSSVADESSDAAVFQLIHTLAPNLDTLVLEGELPRDPPADPSVPIVQDHRPSLMYSLDSNEEVATEPAPECSLRELIWRGKLPPSPALLAWLLSAKAKGASAIRKRSRLEVLELCHLPPPDALADLLREHVSTLQSLRLHYFEAAHVDVVRQLLGRGSPSAPTLGARKQSSFSSKGRLRELVLHRQCSVAPDLLRAIQAQHVAVNQPCSQTIQVLQGSSEHGFKRVTIAGGNKEASERVRLACEADGVAFRSVSALAPVW